MLEGNIQIVQYEVMKYINRRNLKFQKEIEKIGKNKVVGVSIDPSKDFHRVLIFSFQGKLLTPPFSIDTLRAGYNLLNKKITSAKNKIRAKRIYIAIEHAGSYSENLFNHLSEKYSEVVYVSPNAVASNRKQKMLHGLKTDDIDAGAIGDLLIRGEYMTWHKPTFTYRKLKNLIYYREKKIVLRSILKNQISFRLDKIYPGINNSFGDNKKIFSSMKYSHVGFSGFLHSGKTIRQLLKTSNDDLFDEFGYRTPSPGTTKIQQIKTRLKELLAPDERLAKEEIRLLKMDLNLYKAINDEIEKVEKEIVELGEKTDAKYLMGQIKGITDIWASIYVGLVGNFKNFKSAGHVYSLSGLSPRSHQSGNTNKSSLGIRRMGNKQLRSILFVMATQVMVCEPVFRDYYHSIKKKQKKPWKKYRIALCRKLNKVLYALIRDKTHFNPEAVRSSS